MRRSYTAVIERGEPLAGEWATEPYEVGWATEALFFVRVLDGPPDTRLDARVQLSPDGIHWLDEGTTLPALRDGMAFVRVRAFGNWLRLAGTVSDDGGNRGDRVDHGKPGGQDARSDTRDPALRALIYLALKE